MRFGALLRGVNVGGVAMPMARVREVLTEAGAGDVRTFLASGNVCFDADAGAAPGLLAGALADEFGYTAWIYLAPLERIAAAAAAYPFETDETTHHPYLVLADDVALLERAVAAADPAAGERAVVTGGVLAWECPRGASLGTPLAKELARAAYRSTTTRNLRTLRKLR